MRRSFFTAIALSVAALGCESQRAAYVQPDYTIGETVTLKGMDGTYIVEVDHQPVDGIEELVPEYGWNDVLVPPGEHHLRVILNRVSDNRVLTRTVGFNFRCDAGHVYQFASNSPSDLLTLKVTDENLKQSLVIDRSDEPSINPDTPALASDAAEQQTVETR